MVGWEGACSLLRMNMQLCAHHEHLLLDASRMSTYILWMP